MLNHQPDTDRTFDVTVKRSIPFLIYPPSEYRNRLAQLLMNLAAAYRQHNFEDFDRLANETNAFLDSAGFDGGIKKYIDSFARLQMPLESMYYELAERVAVIEANFNTEQSKKVVKPRKTAKPKSEDFTVLRDQVLRDESTVLRDQVLRDESTVLSDQALKDNMPLISQILNFVKNVPGHDWVSIETIIINFRLTTRQIRNIAYRLSHVPKFRELVEFKRLDKSRQIQFVRWIEPDREE